MAAPAIAATAVQLREYFLSHYHKYCRRNYAYCKSFSPSGYLLKALLIHATVAVKQ